MIARRSSDTQPDIPQHGRVRVLLLLGSLSGGGAERVAVNLFNHCDPAAVDLRIGLLKRSGPYLAQVDPARLTGPAAERSGVAGVLRAPGDIARMIREVRPEVLMTFGMGVAVLTWLGLRGLGRGRPRWICREDSHVVAEIAKLSAHLPARAIVEWMVSRVYRSADRLLAVSQDLAEGLTDRLGIPEGRVTVIHNPIETGQIARSAAAPLEQDGSRRNRLEAESCSSILSLELDSDVSSKRHQALAAAPGRAFIVTAGRLTWQKGHDLLIDAFAASAAARELDLVILGEGPLEGELRARAAALGVADRVKFPGFQTNPWAWFSRARLFVLSSRWEGFGNVIAEAMASGAPVLAADCDFGPREQVTHGVNGWLVSAGDADALAGGLETLLGDPDLAARLAAGGRARSRDFDIGVVAATYTRLFVDEAGAAAVPPGRFPIRLLPAARRSASRN